MEVAMIRALVMTHGNIGRELISVVEMILGPVDGLESLSNSGRSSGDMQADVAQWLSSGENSDGEIVFIDDYGGSCANAALLACGAGGERAIISGVNLAMLLAYITWRDSGDHAELASRLVQKGRESIIFVSGR